jgi:DNA-binding FadR family transcriptional regulator
MEQLEAQYGVSRSVMREVVRVLVSMNLVETRRSVGITVCAVDAWHPFDPQIIRWRLAGPDRMAQLSSLGELRAGVEPIAAELAASRALPEHCGELTRYVIDMSVAARRGDDTALLNADIAFHRTLLIEGLSTVVAEVLRGRADHHLVPDNHEHPEVELHLAVATAIQSGDAAVGCFRLVFAGRSSIRQDDVRHAP